MKLGDTSEDGRFVTIGGPIDRAHVSLIVYGDDLDPAEVTAFVGLEPTKSHRKGDPTPSTHRNPRLRYRTGMWMLDSPLPSGADVEDHLERLLDQIEPRSAAFHRLQDQGFDVMLSLGLFLDRLNRGAELAARTVRRIGAFGVRLSLDIYCCEEPENVEA